MVALPYSFKVRVVQRGSRRDFNQLSEIAFTDIATYFHANMRADRFTSRHAQIVGYTPRKPSYERKKKALMRHNNPLVWSGKSRDASMTGVTIRTSGKQAEVRYPSLRGLNRKHPASQVNMVQDFIKMSNREVATLVRRYDTILDRLLKENGFTVTKSGSLRAPGA